MTKPYLLIAGDQHYPSAYTHDWKGCFETYGEAKEYYESLGDRYDWYEIIDLRKWTER